MRRIGVLNSFAETDPEAQAWDAAFRKRQDELGWTDGRNIRVDYRWGAGNTYGVSHTKIQRLKQAAAGS